MKIRMLANADFRVRVGLVQAFHAGRSYSIPKATAEALIARGVAEPVARRDETETAEKE